MVARISQGKIGSKDSLGKVEILLQLKCGRPLCMAPKKMENLSISVKKLLKISHIYPKIN